MRRRSLHVNATAILAGEAAEVRFHRSAADEQRAPRRRGRPERRQQHVNALLRHEPAQEPHDVIGRGPPQLRERPAAETRIRPEPLDVDAR